jgi:outer membrane protein OmpA-like peptidoglycan-associated protein
MDRLVADDFTRSRGTWLVLLCALGVWLVTSFWAYRVAASSGVTEALDTPTERIFSSITGRVSQFFSDTFSAAENEQAAEEARIAAEELAAEEARLMALAEEQAAEQARLLAEEQAAEEARLLAEEQAAEQAAQLLAEEQAAEEARLLAEEQAAEQAVEVLVMVDTDRLPETSSSMTENERLRAEELSVLAGLSARLRFQGRSEVVNRDVARVLDRMFDPLFLYSDTGVVVTVATNEFRGNADNNRLSRDRCDAIVDYLVSRGLERNRFRIQPQSGIGLPYGSHRIKMAIEELEE